MSSVIPKCDLNSDLQLPNRGMTYGVIEAVKIVIYLVEEANEHPTKRDTYSIHNTVLNIQGTVEYNYAQRRGSCTKINAVFTFY